MSGFINNTYKRAVSITAKRDIKRQISKMIMNMGIEDFGAIRSTHTSIHTDAAQFEAEVLNFRQMLARRVLK